MSRLLTTLASHLQGPLPRCLGLSVEPLTQQSQASEPGHRVLDAGCSCVSMAPHRTVAAGIATPPAPHVAGGGDGILSSTLSCALHCLWSLMIVMTAPVASMSRSDTDLSAVGSRRISWCSIHHYTGPLRLWIPAPPFSPQKLCTGQCLDYHCGDMDASALGTFMQPMCPYTALINMAKTAAQDMHVSELQTSACNQQSQTACADKQRRKPPQNPKTGCGARRGAEDTGVSTRGWASQPGASRR